MLAEAKIVPTSAEKPLSFSISAQRRSIHWHPHHTRLSRIKGAWPSPEKVDTKSEADRRLL